MPTTAELEPPDVAERLERDPAFTLTEHLGELRRRLLVCLLTVTVAASVSFRYAETILEWLKHPAGTLLPRLAFFHPTEAFTAHLKLALASGVVLALPMILFQGWAFVKPALSCRGRFYGLAMVWWGSVLFLAGAAFAYGGLLPTFLQFLLGFGGSQLEPVISISRYLSFVTGTILVCGVLFELPLVLFVLSRLELIRPSELRRHRPLAILIMLVVAALVTPTTDAFGMLLLTVPLLALYEISIWVTALASRRAR